MLGRLVDLHHAIAPRHSAGQQVEAEKVDQWLAGKHDDTVQTQALILPEEVEAENSHGLERTLEELAARVASSQSKRVSLRCSGLDGVPQPYRRAVKDITIQLVRNAVVHGIELPDERARAHKSVVGELNVEFAALENDGYELTVQDDGRGLQLERIREVAIERGLITAEQAQLLDPRRPWR